MKKLAILAFATWLSASPLEARQASSIATVMAFDISRSMAERLPEMQASAIEIVNRLPDGSTLAILEVGATVSPSSIVTVNAASRSGAIATISQLRAVAPYTDLGTAIATGASMLAVSKVTHRRIALLTDASANPMPGTPHIGKTLETLLRDDGLLPSNVELFVLVPTGTTVQVETGRLNVHFIAAAQWPDAGPGVPSSLPEVAAPELSPTLTPWALGTGIAGAGSITVGVIILVLARLRRRQQDAARPVPSAEIADAPDAAAAAEMPTHTPGFMVRTNVGDAALHIGQPVLEVGSQWNAFLRLPGAGGAAARFILTTRKRVEVHNTGSEQFYLGTLRARPGSTHVLPSTSAHLRLGTEDVFVFPTTVSEERPHVYA